MKLRFQIPLYKLFVVTAVYAAALGLSSRIGGGWWAWQGVALMLGTAISGLVLVAKSGDFYLVMDRCVFTLAGAVLGMGELAPWLVVQFRGQQGDVITDAVRSSALLIAAAIGIIGGCGVSLLIHRLQTSQSCDPDNSPPDRALD